MKNQKKGFYFYIFLIDGNFSCRSIILDKFKAAIKKDEQLQK